MRELTDIDDGRAFERPYHEWTAPYAEDAETFSIFGTVAKQADGWAWDVQIIGPDWDPIPILSSGQDYAVPSCAQAQADCDTEVRRFAEAVKGAAGGM